MDDRTVSNVGACFKLDGGSWKHVDHTVFLDIAPIAKLYFAPVATQHSPGANEAMCSYGHMANDHGLWMDKSSGVHHRNHVFEGLDHTALGFSIMVAYPWPTPMQRVTKAYLPPALLS